MRWFPTGETLVIQKSVSDDGTVNRLSELANYISMLNRRGRMPASTRKRKTKSWELDVCYPASHFPKADKDVEEATGVHCHSSGCASGNGTCNFTSTPNPRPKRLADFVMMARAKRVARAMLGPFPSI